MQSHILLQYSRMTICEVVVVEALMFGMFGSKAIDGHCFRPSSNAVLCTTCSNAHRNTVATFAASSVILLVRCNILLLCGPGGLTNCYIYSTTYHDHSDSNISPYDSCSACGSYSLLILCRLSFSQRPVSDLRFSERPCALFSFSNRLHGLFLLILLTLDRELDGVTRIWTLYLLIYELGQLGTTSRTGYQMLRI